MKAKGLERVLLYVPLIVFSLLLLDALFPQIERLGSVPRTMTPNDAVVMTAIATVVYTVISLGIFIFALFQKDYNSWRRRPILELFIIYDEPDCQKTKIKAPPSSDIEARLIEHERQYKELRQLILNRGRAMPRVSDAFEKRKAINELERKGRADRAMIEAERPVDAHYFRLRVRNSGRGKAENVEVFATELTKRQNDGSWRRVQKFLPQNLLWTHINNALYPALSPSMEKNCDLGFVRDPSRRTPEDRRILDINDNSVSFDFSVQVPTFTLNHVITSGTYQLKLSVAAENARPRAYTLEITMTGEWFGSNEQMREQAIQMRLLE